MQFSDVLAQLKDVYSRAIETSASVNQNYFAISEAEASKTIGDLHATAIALRDVPYSNIYTELNEHNQYHLKFPDGGLMIFQYAFGKGDRLKKHRLAYFPSPTLPTIEEAPALYEQDELYGDLVAKRIVRFPVRFDYDPDNYTPRVHPHSHLTLGQFENCRIPVTHPVSPNAFLLFVLRNFYFQLYRRYQNKFDKRITKCAFDKCITEAEIGLPHLAI